MELAADVSMVIVGARSLRPEFSLEGAGGATSRPGSSITVDRAVPAVPVRVDCSQAEVQRGVLNVSCLR